MSVVKTAGMERGSAHSVLQRRKNFRAWLKHTAILDAIRGVIICVGAGNDGMRAHAREVVCVWGGGGQK